MEIHKESTLEEQKVLEKYVAASLKAYPLLLQFCKDLNAAVGDMRTNEEKEADENEHARIKAFLEKARDGEKQRAYNKGYFQAKRDVDSSTYVFFDVVDSPEGACSFFVKKRMTRQEFRDRLADWGKFV